MKKRNKKYNGSVMHRGAILHMVGESETIFKREVLVRDIAEWMNVSKPTAIRYLKAMAWRGEIIMTKEKCKSNASIFKIKLSDVSKQKYHQGAYKTSYIAYNHVFWGASS